MCIFNVKVSEVAKTKIFVGKTSKNRQITIYSNYVDLEGKRYKKGSKVERMSNEATPAMILPFPIGDGVVELIDLSYYSNLFQDLEDIFPTVVNLMRSRNKSKKRSLSSLDVLSVGNYKVSVAGSLEDLKRIDKDVFVLADNVEEILSHKYNNGFGFLICVIVKGKKKHPIAYTHSLLSSKTEIKSAVKISSQNVNEINDDVDEKKNVNEDIKSNEEGEKIVEEKEKKEGEIEEKKGEEEEEFSLFVPTLHEHGDDEDKKGVAKWDHEIYSLNTTKSAGDSENDYENFLAQKYAKAIKRQDKKIIKGKTNVKSIFDQLPIELEDYSHLRCFRLTGKEVNGDLIFQICSSTNKEAKKISVNEEKIKRRLEKDHPGFDHLIQQYSFNTDKNDDQIHLVEAQ